ASCGSDQLDLFGPARAPSWVRTRGRRHSFPTPLSPSARHLRLPSCPYGSAVPSTTADADDGMVAPTAATCRTRTLMEPPMSTCLILAAALIAVATIDGAAQARSIETHNGPVASARQADETQVAALNAYLRLKGQKAGGIKGAGAQAAPATT